MPEPDLPTNEPVRRYYLVLFQSGDREDPFGSLHPFIVPVVQKKLDDKIVSSPDQTEIDVWIESPGGDAHATYKLFLDLRSRCRKLRAVVPDCAKSAATLLVLGADEIYMAPAAELGPLDAQIEHPDRENVTVSALDVAKALTFLADFGLDYVVKAGLPVLRSTELPRLDVLRELSRFAASLLRPIIAKLDGHLIHRAVNQLDIAHRYARIMLGKRNLSSEDRAVKLDAAGLASHLCEDYPAHEFVISREEARKLPLPVRDAEQYLRWAEAKAYHSGFHDGLFATDDSASIIHVLDDSDIGKFFEENGTEDADDSSVKDVQARRGKNHETCSDDHQPEGFATDRRASGPGTPGTT